MENGLNKRTRVSDFLCMLPAFVFVLSILLVRLHMFSMPMTDIYWSADTDTSTMSDLFSFWKAMAIICAACIAIIVFVIGYFKDSIHFKKSFLYVPMLIYVAFVLISLALSNYKYFALRGMSEHFEGTIVLLAYIVMTIFLVNAVDSERRLRLVLYCASGAALLLGILGITQAMGNDFLSTTVGQKLMTPNYTLESGIKSWDMIDLMNSTGQKVYDFSFTEGEVYQTVYNINYVSFYLSLLIPVSAILFVFFGMRKTKEGIAFSAIYLLSYGLLLYNFFAANSASGYFGLLTAFVSALIIFRKTIKLWIKPLICLIVVTGLVLGVSTDRWLPELKTKLGNIAVYMTVPIFAENTITVQQEFDRPPACDWINITEIETKDNTLLFGVQNGSIIITRNNDNSSFEIADGEGNQLYLTNISNEEGVFQILDERFHDYLKISLERDSERTYLVIHTVLRAFRFAYDDNGFTYANDVGKFVKLSKIEHAGIFKDYSTASLRGRIWDTTIPMLKTRLFYGSGADTYTFVYPQNDYVSLYNSRIYSGTYLLNLVTDKAHNLYMQYWVNTGLISLLAWLTLVGYYLVGAVKQFRKRGFVEFPDFVNGGIFCGIIGFLFVAFFNDGSVNTMPMFYTMLGTGLAINMRDKWPEASSGETEGKDGKKSTEVMPEV